MPCYRKKVEIQRFCCNLVSGACCKQNVLDGKVNRTYISDVSHFGALL